MPAGMRKSRFGRRRFGRMLTAMTPGLITRRRSLILAAGALAAPPALALAASDSVRTLPEAQFTPENAEDDLVAMEDRLRRMTAPVMINGMGPFDFVVDTGTNRSVLSDELVAELGLAHGQEVRVHGIAGERDAQTAAVDRFGVGGRVARRLTMPCLPQRWLGGAGLLGVDGLKNQRVVLELQKQRLRIEPSSTAPREAGGSVIRARRRYGQLTVVDTDLSGVQVSVMIDTGAEVTIGNSALRRAVERRVAPAAPGPAVIQGATGEKFVGEYGVVPQFRMGSLKISNLRVVYADLHPFRLWDLTEKPAMLMAMDVIRFFEVLSVDFGRDQVRFDLPAQPFIDPAGTFRPLT